MIRFAMTSATVLILQMFINGTIYAHPQDQLQYPRSDERQSKNIYIIYIYILRCGWNTRSDDERQSIDPVVHMGHDEFICGT